MKGFSMNKTDIKFFGALALAVVTLFLTRKAVHNLTDPMAAFKP